jgi:hypothetical protein
MYRVPVIPITIGGYDKVLIMNLNKSARHFRCRANTRHSVLLMVVMRMRIRCFKELLFAYFFLLYGKLCFQEGE